MQTSLNLARPALPAAPRVAIQVITLASPPHFGQTDYAWSLKMLLSPNLVFSTAC
ncbi:MAG: hypothetical protein P8Z77_16350 [Candidatus Thiodiazotropha sp.]